LTALLVAPTPFSATTDKSAPPIVPSAIFSGTPQFVPPLHHSDFDQDVLVPLKEAQREKYEKDKTSCEAAEGHMEAGECILPPPPPPVAPVVVPAPVATNTTITINNYSSGELNGSVGYSSAWGNCVNEPGVNNPGWGNPINWPTTSGSPWIGASALFYTNHVAVVTGLWSNGDIEVRQQNSPGMPHRLPRAMIRGYR
jgi:hypothetical protein